MNYLDNIVHRISVVAAIIAGIFLLLIMLLTVANVVFRVAGGCVQGAYEAAVILIVVVASCTFVYTTREDGHITVEVVKQRFPQRVQRILQIFSSAITIVVIALVAWGGIQVLSARWLGEKTELLRIPYLPARFIFIIGLGLFCLVAFIEIYKNLKGPGRK